MRVLSEESARHPPQIEHHAEELDHGLDHHGRNFPARREGRKRRCGSYRLPSPVDGGIGLRQ